jgi:hypothetical protein
VTGGKDDKRPHKRTAAEKKDTEMVLCVTGISCVFFCELHEI